MRHKTFARYGTFVTLVTTVPSAFALDLPNAPAPPNIPNQTVILSAPADGVTDATAAINTAITSLAKAGGGTLQFGDGTYLVTVNPNANFEVLNIQNYVRLAGAPDGGTIIKLADAQGPYYTLIGNNSTVHDIAIDYITIDMNGQNNLITSEAERAVDPRMAVHIGQGGYARVADCTFVNVDDVNTLDFNGGTVSDVEVADNSFTVGMPPGSFDFDHSTIYTHAKRISVHDNTFVAAYGPGTPTARTAIEIHGDDMSVVNNMVDGYSIGTIITGQAISSNRQLYKFNVLKNVMSGMEIVSEQWPNATTPYGMQNITIEYNQLAMSPFVWRKTPLIGSAQPSPAIFFNPTPTNPAPISGLAIIGNQIIFPTGGSPVSGDEKSGGIILWSYNGLMTSISNMLVSNNRITNALGPAIWSNMNLTGGTVISSNTILNPARSSACVETTGIYISGATANILVESNEILDTATPSLITPGIDAISSCDSSCVLSTNTVRPYSVTPSSLGSGWTQ